MTQSTLIVPADLTDQDALRLFLQRLVEEVDKAKGIKQ
jgi:hypothetical protein